MYQRTSMPCLAPCFLGGSGAIGAALLSLALVSCGGGSGSPASPPDPVFVDSATGNDANFGDVGRPLHTIAQAVELVEDGHTIIVAPGEYRESVTTDRKGPTPRGLQFVADFTGELSGVAAGEVVVNPSSPGAVAFKLNNSPGTVIDGFSVTGGGGGGIVVNRSDGAQVQNCVVANNDSPTGQADGIRVQDSANVLLFNNLVFANSESGIALVGSQQGSAGAVVINNTVAVNGAIGVEVGTSDVPSPGAFMRNNIVFDNGGTGTAGRNIVVRNLPASGEGYDADFNLVFPATYEPPGIQGMDDTAADPMFRGSPPLTASDFLLSPDSPAVDPSPRAQMSNDLKRCLQRWSTEGGKRDSGAVDLGYHLPLADPHCGLVLPPLGSLAG